MSKKTSNQKKVADSVADSENTTIEEVVENYEIPEMPTSERLNRFSELRMSSDFYAQLKKDCFPAFMKLITDTANFTKLEFPSNDALGALGDAPRCYLDDSMQLLSSTPYEVPEEIVIVNAVIATYANQIDAATSVNRKQLLDLCNQYLDFVSKYVPLAQTENLRSFMDDCK